jgi:hypothetical protein
VFHFVFESAILREDVDTQLDSHCHIPLLNPHIAIQSFETAANKDSEHESHNNNGMMYLYHTQI